MSVLNKLTEGIVNRDMKKEGEALLAKWQKTGLLEGLDNDTTRNGMARLLENQAKELLREAASTMQGGDVQGFASVAFPIVRRVFGGLIANDLVSVQPMSLPSGLIFFMDFTYGDTRLGNYSGTSLYGGGVVGSQVTGGVSLTGNNAERGFYALNNGYSSPTGSSNSTGSEGITYTAFARGTFGGPPASGCSEEEFNKILRYDPDFTSGTTSISICTVDVSDLSQLNTDNLISVTCGPPAGGTDVFSANLPASGSQARRLTQFSGSLKDKLFVVFHSDTLGVTALNTNARDNQTTWGINDQFSSPVTADPNAVGAVVGATEWGLENDPGIPEINIKVDSVAVTAMTKKLKAKWTPELGQDLNAYHNLDAEVELTSILSEQIALEIDQEILEDLIVGATAGTLYWSRSPGLFLNRETGIEIGASSAAPDFTGTVSEWYETCLETVNDVSARIHRKTLRGGANFLVTSPEVASILEFTAGFRASVTVDGERGTAGAMKVGQLSKKLDVYVDPYFPRNLILVGRKGASFLESGYVYAPYVPLQVTPTIFGIEDFVPRKGVMTRYAKKMVRPDMYGLVIVRGLVGEAGATS